VLGAPTLLAATLSHKRFRIAAIHAVNSYVAGFGSDPPVTIFACPLHAFRRRPCGSMRLAEFGRLVMPLSAEELAVLVMLHASVTPSSTRCWRRPDRATAIQKSPAPRRACTAAPPRGDYVETAVGGFGSQSFSAFIGHVFRRYCGAVFLVIPRAR
jgi:hypothetical protein